MKQYFINQCDHNGTVKRSKSLSFDELIHPGIFRSVVVYIVKLFSECVHLLFRFIGTSRKARFQPCVFLTVDDTVRKVFIKGHQQLLELFVFLMLLVKLSLYLLSLCGS